MEKSNEIDTQVLLLIKNIIKIPEASDNFIKDDSKENLILLADIVAQSEKEFGIMVQKLTDIINDKNSVEIEAIETENGFEVK